MRYFIQPPLPTSSTATTDEASRYAPPEHPKVYAVGSTLDSEYVSKCEAVRDKLLGGASANAKITSFRRLLPTESLLDNQLSQPGSTATHSATPRIPSAASRDIQSITIGGFSVPVRHPSASFSTPTPPALRIQPEFHSRFYSVISAVEAYSEQRSLVDPRDYLFVEVCALAQNTANIEEVPGSDAAYSTVTYLIDEYGADLYEKVCENPDFSNVVQLPSLDKHVPALRYGHYTRYKTGQVEDVVTKTKQKCTDVVRDELRMCLPSIVGNLAPE